ncbi:chromosome partitioning protein ParB [Anaerostipes sp. 992a]|uniref:ParB/RepB/Spo0J family partition protein n=1 Tax=Anaerostipes sp. 992a TaxID=1261637 RepID=UPI00095249DE|nr:ParB/RepB/Spo0J family partition protein [Anaerostipes sp. 992a]MDD5968399.1 ParB/RepB/Spo0J family partition protein [Anaerostipes sp.]OLR63236.1 chromosome partitioning protein ParB [Anaerostipes sp. 992a]
MTAKKKNALGKGLNVLIPETGPQPPQRRRRKSSSEASDQGVMISVNEIEPNRNQPRKTFDDASLQELAESIKQFGIIQPIVVKKKDEYYEIIAGERRWRAAKIAGLLEVPVIVKEYKENEIVEISLIENIQRENLNPIEEAQAYKTLMEEFELKQEEVAQKVSKSRSTITNSLRLLKLTKEVQEMLVEEKISMGHARALLAITDPDIQISVAKKVYEEALSVRDIEKLVKDMAKPAKKEEKEPNEYQYLYRDIEENLKQILGNKVTIKNRKNNKGKIEIEYYSQDDLERIIELLQR